jgi:hypothetical protein
MLVLAHTPKRNLARPLTVNNLQDSKMLINFCDSAFATGKNQSTPGHRNATDSSNASFDRRRR